MCETFLRVVCLVLRAGVERKCVGAECTQAKSGCGHRDGEKVCQERQMRTRK